MRLKAFSMTVSTKEVTEPRLRKRSHFQRFGLKIFDDSTKAANTQELRVGDGLLGVIWVRGGKQKVPMGVNRLVIHIDVVSVSSYNKM